MATPELVIRLGNLEVTSHDPLAIRTAWGLIGTSISEEEGAFLNGDKWPERDTRPEREEASIA